MTAGDCVLLRLEGYRSGKELTGRLAPSEKPSPRLWYPPARSGQEIESLLSPPELLNFSEPKNT